MTDIILSKEAILKNAIGTRTNHLTKPVLCITDRKWFTSVTDTAEAYEVSVFAISAVCNKKMRTCKGKRFCFVQDYDEYLEEILSEPKHTDDEYDELKREVEILRKQNNALESDAAIGRAIREEEERKQKAEQERLELIEHTKQAIESAKAEYARRQRIAEQKDAELQRAVADITETEMKIEELNLKLLGLEGAIKGDDNKEDEDK